MPKPDPTKTLEQKAAGVMATQPLTTDKDTGLATVWHNDNKEWKKLMPVDCYEGIAMGIYSTTAPDGTAPVAEVKSEGTAPPTNDELRKALGAKPKDQLRGLCDAKGVAWHTTDTKETLIEALVSKGVMPEG